MVVLIICANHVVERRIIITHAAAIAWKLICERYLNLLWRAFEGPGLLLHANPTVEQLKLVKPQGFPDDYGQHYLSGENLDKLQESIREEMGMAVEQDDISETSGDPSINSSIQYYTNFFLCGCPS